MTGRETLMALLREVSRQSEAFQSLIHDYASDVMADPAMHRPFSERLAADLPMRRQIAALKASLRAESGPLSPAMQDVLVAVDDLQADSHTNLTEIADLVALELVYKLREAAPETHG